MSAPVGVPHPGAGPAALPAAHTAAVASALADAHRIDGTDLVSSHHWLVDASGCRCDAALLAWVQPLRERTLGIARDCGMQVMGDCFYQFEPSGVTGTVLLAESHIALHTWPEKCFVSLDVYVCDHTTANRDKGYRAVQDLLAMLNASSARVQPMHRASVAPSHARF